MNIIKTLFLVLFVGLQFISYAQEEDTTKKPKIKVIEEEIKYNVKKINIQWASKVVDVSSQYSKVEKSALQILGKPNVMPVGGPSPCAWAVKKKGSEESPKPAFIRVGFDKPMKVQQVAIAESFNPGAIEKIVLYGKAQGEEKVVYESSPATVNKECRMLYVFMDPTSFDVTEGTIFLQPGLVPGWNEIDAFGLCDQKDTIKVAINVVPNLHFSSKRESLGPNINTQYDEISPKISPDGRTIYFDRKFTPQNIGGEKDEDDIWVSKMDEKGIWSPAVNIGAPLNDKNNDFVQAITPDGNTLLLGNTYNVDGSMGEGVSISNKIKDGWSFPQTQEIEGYYNLNKYANCYLSNDNRYLILAIEMKDSYGGLDLYICQRKGENKWSKPKNFGKQINTVMNDYSPFLAADGVTLYFSTSGLSGYGKEDIFMTRRLDETWVNWSDPQNLGSDVNSKESDTKYNIPASGEYAYYSSTLNSVGLNDIFRIKLPSAVKPKPVVLVRGKVLNERNGKPVSAEIIYETLPDGKEVGRARTDPNTGEYTIVLPAGYNYAFRAIADDFIGVAQNLNLKDINEYTEIEQSDLRLAPIEVGAVVTLNNIFFEYAKAVLKPESFPELNRVVEFLEQNPKVAIEIGGHTDNSGSDATNDRLSKNRAQAVADYLILNGIGSDRIAAVGYGKHRPIAFNDDEEGRAKNRRVEFTIMKK
ncbi:MAG: OmpA family protein [Bacteroidia bacterium]|nr:OmpA family protein [Bacteroidia bacterium]